MASIKDDLGALSLLLFLYFLQGVPIGLASSLPLYLASKGASLKDQAIFSLASWPYSLKLLWAPVVDVVWTEKWNLGQRKSWIIPVQILTGVVMVILGSKINYLLEGSGEAVVTVDVPALLGSFLLLYFLVATQDIAVDGWALTLLRPENVGYASMANTVGQGCGIMSAYGLFIALDSPELVNKYIRLPLGLHEQDYGLVGMGGFLTGWGIVFLISTFIVWFARSEISPTSTPALVNSDKQTMSTDESSDDPCKTSLAGSGPYTMNKSSLKGNALNEDEDALLLPTISKSSRSARTGSIDMTPDLTLRSIAIANNGDHVINTAHLRNMEAPTSSAKRSSTKQEADEIPSDHEITVEDLPTLTGVEILKYRGSTSSESFPPIHTQNSPTGSEGIASSISASKKKFVTSSTIRENSLECSSTSLRLTSQANVAMKITVSPSTQLLPESSSQIQSAHSGRRTHRRNSVSALEPTEANTVAFPAKGVRKTITTGSGDSFADGAHDYIDSAIASDVMLPAPSLRERKITVSDRDIVEATHERGSSTIISLATETGTSLVPIQDSNITAELREAYSSFFTVIKLPTVLSLALVLVTVKAGFAAMDSASTLELIDRGIPRETVAAVDMLSFPVQVLLQVGPLAKLTAGPRPLEYFINLIKHRTLVSLLCLVVIYKLIPDMSSTPHNVADVPWYVFFAIFIMSNVMAAVSSAMFMAQMAFFTRVAVLDPKSGGSTMTLLNTLANLGAKWPGPIVLLLIDYFTRSACVFHGVVPALDAAPLLSCDTSAGKSSCLVAGGSCVTTQRGFLIVVLGSCIYSAIWYLIMRKRVLSIQAAPPAAWGFDAESFAPVSPSNTPTVAPPFKDEKIDFVSTQVAGKFEE